MKEAVQEREVFKEKVPEIFGNSKNAMTVLDTDKFERHTCGAFHSIFVPTGRTKAAVTAKRSKLEITAMGTGVHGTAKRGIAGAYFLRRRDWRQEVQVQRYVRWFPVKVLPASTGLSIPSIFPRNSTSYITSAIMAWICRTNSRSPWAAVPITV